MYEFWIFITAALVAVSCALVGSLLVLRRMAMLGDAISHSVLLGIVLTYILFHKTSIHWMLAGAAISGFLTVWLSEFIHSKAKVPQDASLGLVFTWFFALAIILLSMYAEQVHLDHEHVLFGEMAFIPFHPLMWGELSLGPVAFWLALIVFLINLVVVGLSLERFKATTFNPVWAVSLGLFGWHYLLVSLVSFTAVASFDVAGSILVVAFLVVPAATAYLIAKSLEKMLVYAVIFAVSAVALGFGAAVLVDTSLSASMTIASGLLFFITLATRKHLASSCLQS